MDQHDDFGGLQRDMPLLLGRREALRWMGGASLAGLLAACGSNSSDTPAAAATILAPTTTTATTIDAAAAPATTAASTTTNAGVTTEPPATVSAGTEIPDETAGPFPADGTNGPNVLAIDGVAKPDLTTSFGDLAGTAEGIPVTFNLTVVDAATGDARPGAVVYLWHCTADGRYSIYEIADQNYLRGVQAADAGGKVTFSSVFPGCYPGRWPHCHFEVYPSLDDATVGATPIKTSQLALPRADCEAAYADDRYGDSSANLARLSLDTDGVFRDGWKDQLAVVTGSPADGYGAALLVRV